jgi:hypothetical protein
MPLRMRRPSAVREALGFSRLMQLVGAHASGVKGIWAIPSRGETGVKGRRKPDWYADAKLGMLSRAQIDEHHATARVRVGQSRCKYDIIATPPPFS